MGYQSTEGDTIWVSLKVVAAYRADHTVADAYELRVVWADLMDKHLTITLDGAGRVVSEGPFCIVPPSCDQVLRDWSWHAFLGPMGIGWRDHVTNGTLLVVDGLPMSAIPAELAGNELRLERTPGLATPLTPLPVPTRATYDASVFPITFSDGATTWTRIQEDGRLPALPPQSLSRLPVTQMPRAYVLFPGETEDPFGSGFSPRAALDWLVARQPSVGQVLDNGGCVSTAYFRVPTHPPALVPGNPLNASSSQIELAIRTSSGDSQRWRFQYRTSLLDTAFTEPTSEPDSWRTSCAFRSGSMRPLGDFQAFVASHPSYHNHPYDTYGFSLRSLRDASFLPGSESGEEYFVFYQPDSVECGAVCSYTPDRMSLRPSDLSMIRFHMDASRTFPEQ